MADVLAAHGSSILLVDDRLSNLLALEAVLEPLGHRLVRARSGDEALQRLQEEEFALVLMDVQMPGIDGFETARLIRSREKNRTLPILFLTALSVERTQVMRAYASGAVDFLTKPIQTEVLLAKVSFFVGLHQKVAELRGSQGMRVGYAGSAFPPGSEQALAFMVQASEVLAASLDDETTLRRMAELVVPTLADFCAVDLAEGEGQLRRLTVCHVGPQPDAATLKAAEIYGLDPEARFSPHVALRRGEPLLQMDADEAFWSGVARNEEHRAALQALGFCSGVIIPLQTRGRNLGALSLYYAESGRHYTPTDVELAVDLGRRCAMCVDNARLYAEAQTAVRVRDQFLSIASHELKTPLTPLSLRLQSIEREAQAQPQSPVIGAIRQHLRSAQSQVRRLTDLVQNLLDVSRINDGRLTLKPQAVDATQVIEHVVRRFTSQAAQLGSTLELMGLDHSLPGLWDRSRLEQILVNLLSNALKYGAGRPIQVVVQDGGEHLMLIVRDLGIGIAPQDLQRIFGRFERAVSDRNYGGLGLGLFVTRQLVQTLGGVVHVVSEQGQGSTFTVMLPKQPPGVLQSSDWMPPESW